MMEQQEKIAEEPQESGEIANTNNSSFDIVDYTKTSKEDENEEQQNLTYFNENNEKTSEEDTKEPEVNVEEEIKRMRKEKHIMKHYYQMSFQQGQQ